MQLEVDQSIRTLSDTSHPWWFTVMNWMLFYSPHAYVKCLKKIWAEKHLEAKFQYRSKLIEEPQDDRQTPIISVGFL